MVSYIIIHHHIPFIIIYHMNALFLFSTNPFGPMVFPRPLDFLSHHDPASQVTLALLPPLGPLEICEADSGLGAANMGASSQAKWQGDFNLPLDFLSNAAGKK